MTLRAMNELKQQVVIHKKELKEFYEQQKEMKKEIDKLKNLVNCIHEWKLQKEGI